MTSFHQTCFILTQIETYKPKYHLFLLDTADSEPKIDFMTTGIDIIQQEIFTKSESFPNLLS